MVPKGVGKKKAMTKLEPRECLSIPSLSAASTDDETALLQFIGTICSEAAQYMKKRGLTEKLTKLYPINSLRAEMGFKGANIAMCRMLLAQTFEDIEDQGPFLDR